MQGKGHGEIHLRGWYWPFDMLYSQGGNARMVRAPSISILNPHLHALYSCKDPSSLQVRCPSSPLMHELPIGPPAGWTWKCTWVSDHKPSILGNWVTNARAGSSAGATLAGLHHHAAARAQPAAAQAPPGTSRPAEACHGHRRPDRAEAPPTYAHSLCVTLLQSLDERGARPRRQMV